MSDPDLTLLRQFVTALQSRNRAAVNDAARTLIDRGGPLGEKWRAVAKVMQTNGELGDANRAMELLAAQGRGSASLVFEQAALAAQTGRLDDARALLQTLPPHIPDPAGHAFLLGTIALNLGRIDDAERHLLTALDANPKSGQAMLALSACRKREWDDPVSARILDAGPKLATAHPLERSQYHYAAGALYFDRTAVEPAFGHFAEGARLAATQRPYDRATDRKDAEQSRAEFGRAAIDRIAATVRADSSDAIFVTGLPRSGTTLVEQILASHSAVIGGEELGRMNIVVRDLPENSIAGLQAYLARSPADTLSRLYLHLCRERFSERGRFVDKGLNSSRHIGLIASLLPQSPVIWIRRDPLDCAWSAFRTYFASGVDWSWKLADIAYYFQLEDALYAYWSQLLPDRILTVDYAQLVTDPEHEIARILDFCGLAQEEAPFAPHKTERVVSTASVMQVRQPINRAGLGNAEPYRSHLQPFIDAYLND
ncbi:tetratricopeptide repeat-containing sulfotransferase family protein [Sphingosinithalassobacter portus]|uniref:tetratricopeptide repeat-containing sulfotransferase family protein n=1 Tax=Stakelama portus TaxID=2676234 RepID=UPI000D6DE04C|nr:sulfotransferase [Sphingosinithalassobacter portus]